MEGNCLLKYAVCCLTDADCMEAVLYQIRTLYLIMHTSLTFVIINFNIVDKFLTFEIFHINLFGTGFCCDAGFILKLT